MIFDRSLHDWNRFRNSISKTFHETILAGAGRLYCTGENHGMNQAVRSTSSLHNDIYNTFIWSKIRVWTDLHTVKPGQKFDFWSILYHTLMTWRSETIWYLGESQDHSGNYIWIKTTRPQPRRNSIAYGWKYDFQPLYLYIRSWPVRNLISDRFCMKRW